MPSVGRLDKGGIAMVWPGDGVDFALGACEEEQATANPSPIIKAAAREDPRALKECMGASCRTDPGDLEEDLVADVHSILRGDW
jgi:hypothetical protein